MKKVFLIACVTSLVLFFSCNKETNTNNSYTVKTTINGIPDGVRAFLKVPNEKGQPMPKDTAIVQNGKFTFYGTSEVPEMGFIYVNGAEGNITFILEKGDLLIEAEKTNLMSAKISGGKHNDEYATFLENSVNISKKIKSVSQRYSAAVKEKDTSLIKTLKIELNKFQKEGTKYQKDYVASHPDSFISLQLVNRMMRYKIMNAKEVKTFYDQLPEDLKKTKVAKNLHIKLLELQRASIGTMAPNFSAPNPEGKMISMYDIRGKVTIIDFWAAWCGPCRRENPNVVKIYNKYHDDGLEIIGVSLDGRQGQTNAKQDWIKAIEKDGLPWHQVSNIAGFRDGIALNYNIRAIPATFVLNEKGEIVAKNLRGEKLEAKVKELLGK